VRRNGVRNEQGELEGYGSCRRDEISWKGGGVPNLGARVRKCSEIRVFRDRINSFGGIDAGRVERGRDQV